MNATLMLENGQVFRGRAFGAAQTRVAEIVFNTAMGGYQEVLTDPSYCGQIVTFTTAQMGNTGINSKDGESQKVWLSGIVVKELSQVVSNFRSEQSLDDFLKDQGVLGISDVDTRAITLAVRNQGAMKALITAEDLPEATMAEMISQAPALGELDPVSEVTCQEPWAWKAAASGDFLPSKSFRPGISEAFKVAVIDFGVKHNILRNLTHVGCDLTVFPAQATASEVMAHAPDGLFLSNGPGDPTQAKAGIQLVKDLRGQLPIFGICLGHQIIALALGAETFKLKFGHHGVNHPVKNLNSGQIEITSQNHGYAVKSEGLPDGVILTHVNLNDQTCSGLKHSTDQIIGVQYHPESAPGPHDSHYLFNDFMAMMQSRRQNSVAHSPS